MNDQARTNQELLEEIFVLKQRIQELEKSEAERKQIEEALRKSEANYRQLFDNSPTGIYQVDFRTGKFLKANDAFCEYLGYSQKEITSITPYDILTKESQKNFGERLNKIAIGDKVPGDPEFEIISKDGKRRWVQLNTKNIYDSEGLVGADVVAHDITDRKRAEEELQRAHDELEQRVADRTKELMGVNKELLTEITERKQAEEELRESEERYKRLMEDAPIGFCVVDISGNIQYVNKKIEEVSGYSRDELIGLNGFTTNLFPAESIQLLAERLAFRIGGGIPHPNEIVISFICKDGTQIWTEINTTVLKKDGVPIGVQLSISDITDRKQAAEALRETEEKYRSLAATTDTMYLVDRECRYLFMNEMHLSRLGVSLDEIAGKPYADLHSEEDTKKFSENVERVFKAGESFQNEHKSERDNRYFIRTFSAVRSPQGNITAVTVISKDITERKRAEEALKEERRRLQQALDEVRTLRGIVPICMNCKKIRDDKGYWNQVEKYVSDRTEAKFSHGICPDCVEKLYPEHKKH